MSDDHATCEHGAAVGGHVTGPCFGMICTCRCCRSSYVLVNSAIYSDGELVVSRTHPEDLCHACGGTPVDYLHPDYEHVERNGFVSLRRRPKDGVG